VTVQEPGFRASGAWQAGVLAVCQLGRSVNRVSIVMNIDDASVGAAIRLDTGYRSIAIDVKPDDLHGSIWPTLADVQRLARQIYLHGC
jgi:hypothetical protein